MRRSVFWLRAAVVLITVASAWLTATRLRVSTDLSTLLPATGDAGALARWTRAFGGKDPALILVRGARPDDVGAVAESLVTALKAAPSVVSLVDRAPALTMLEDPTLAWAYAGPEARRRLAALLTPEAMRERLAETRSLLLAPGADVATEGWLARDPLRLTQVPWAARAELAAGLTAAADAPFVSDGGRARLIVVEARGSPFVSDSARAFMADVDAAETGSHRDGVTIEVAGGHAIAFATEQMLKRDLAVSGTLSLVLASVAFVLTFRRARALAAVLPPLVLGTLWTTGLAALVPTGVAAVAIAFAAVVVGVGVDTGVHVYAGLLAARRAGLAPREAAAKARADTWRPTLVAAVVAGIAFASLALSGLRALQELGLLCGAGELLTAVAIVLVTPEIGAWLERGPPPPERAARWVGVLARMTATRGRSLVALAACALPVVVAAAIGWPRPADALVAVRPQGLAPFVADDHVQELFGRRGGIHEESHAASRGQWVALSIDPDEESARARNDRIAEALEPLDRAHRIDGFDSLATFAPAAATRRARLAERDALDLPSRVSVLRDSLRAAGFDLDACAPALEAFAHPSPDVESSPVPGALAPWLLARHVGHEGGETLAATYVRPHGNAQDDAAARAAILAADPTAVVTGFDAIDRALRAALSHDLLLIGGVALAFVALGMRIALKSARHALVALATLACEIGAVGVAMRILQVRWHVYDALVLPVLFGVTIDESMFLLHAAREASMEESLRTQGPLVAATALTTAAGFAALVACHFDGLRDLGEVGTLGVLAGLVAALVVVPAAARVLR